MSNSRPQNFDKNEIIGSTIGFRFHANDEELEEVQLHQGNPADKNIKEKADNLTPGSLDATKTLVENNEPVADSTRDHWSLLGRRSISVDSAHESSFSNRSETWKKLNVLKGKITKTVEDKINEMKIDRNASSHNKVNHSKESLSISDSEDTSESSKVSEQWIDSETQISTCDKTSDENSETHTNTSETKLVENLKEEEGIKEEKNELRNRKEFSKLINLPEIKIATAKHDVEESPIDSSFGEDVESGVEADENLDGTEEESIDLVEFETVTERERGEDQGSQHPSGGSNFSNYDMSFFNKIFISKTSTLGILLGFILYFFFPLSEFYRGFLLSILLIIFWGTVKSYIYFDETSQHHKSFVISNYKSHHSLKIPESVPVKGVWFNEYENEEYDPDCYSVTQTLPAYLELENSTLKISRPKGKIRRRATFDEPDYKLPIISQRVYDISGCNIYLMPDGLTRKRLFSKKYPIVIYLKPDSLLSEKRKSKEVEDKECEEGTQTEEIPCSESSKSKCILYLFARCDRQKEEWYRKLMSASRLSSLVPDQKNEKLSEPVEDVENKTEKTALNESSKEAGTPFENLFFDDEVNQLEEYFHYMEKFVDVEIVRQKSKEKTHFWFRKPKIKKKDTQGKEDNSPPNLQKGNSCGNSNENKEEEERKPEETSGWGQVLWFSAFVNRVLFDVFRSPYWLEKIQNKIQKKLNSIRLPYYIEDIEVTEMDLGKNGPMFHRVSQPYLNEHGLWFDMDVTFEGLIKLTIQTHLNLIKLQQGLDETEGAEVQIPEKTKKKERKRKQIEKESKDSFLINKDSQQKMEESSEQLSEILSKTFVKSYCPRVSSEELTNESNTEITTSEDAGKFMKEVKQFAEAAVSEKLSEIKEKELKRDDLTGFEKKRSPIYDSDLEDSAESSDEDEENQPNLQPDLNEKQDSVSASRRYPRTRRSSKKIFQVVENVARSKYFRTMAQSKYVQKAIAGVSAARLRLSLEVKSCKGILAVNIPPPPSDRFWFGFREMPTLVFSVNPKIGDKSLRFVHIKNYLQKKILHELKKVMVTPNMIDFVLPTSAPARSSSFLNVEEPDLQEATISE